MEDFQDRTTSDQRVQGQSLHEKNMKISLLSFLKNEETFTFQVDFPVHVRHSWLFSEQFCGFRHRAIRVWCAAPALRQWGAPGVVRKWVVSVCISLGVWEVDRPSSVAPMGLLEQHKEAREPQGPATAERAPPVFRGCRQLHLPIKHRISKSWFAFRSWLNWSSEWLAWMTLPSHRQAGCLPTGCSGNGGLLSNFRDSRASLNTRININCNRHVSKKKKFNWTWGRKDTYL